MNTKRKKKKLYLRLLAAALVLALVFSCAFIAASPEARYILSDKVSHIGSAARLERTSGLEYEGFTLDELSELENVELNVNLMLINEDFPITKKLQNEIVDYKSKGVLMDKNMCEPFSELSRDVLESFDETLYVSSSYRTSEEQAQIKAKEGDIAQAVGASEHQVGLALDVYVDCFAGLSFIKSEAGQFVNSECAEYGFIIRYPYYGKASTGIDYEPWHIRYVGKPHSLIIEKNSITLEEYIEKLEVGEFYKYDGYVISRQSASGKIKLPQKYRNAQISPDNCGNYVVTVCI